MILVEAMIGLWIFQFVVFMEEQESQVAILI